MKRIKRGVVLPEDEPPAKQLVTQWFQDAGWSHDDAEWLAPLALKRFCGEAETHADSVSKAERHLKLIAGSWSDVGSAGSEHDCAAGDVHRDCALLVAYARLVGYPGQPESLHMLRHTETQCNLPNATTPEPSAIAQEFRAHGANFERALSEGGLPGQYECESWHLDYCKRWYLGDSSLAYSSPSESWLLMRSLVEDAGLDLSNVLNVNSLLEIGSDRMGPEPPLRTGVPKRPDYQTIESRDPRTLTTWLLVLGPDALSSLLPKFLEATSEHDLASLAFGIRDCIERWLFRVAGHWEHSFSAGVELADATKPFMRELERRYLIAGSEHHNLRRAWLWFVRCTAEAEAGDPQDETHVATETRERALHAANESIARLRPLLARARVRDALHTEVNSKSSVSGSASSLESWEEFEWEKDHLITCEKILFLFGGLWRGMKPMLLAMRALACPCVASDLRYWEEERQRGRDAPFPEPTQPPTPWQLIPTLMVNLFHGFARREQLQDPELQSLRGEFAAFCLRGLADRWTERERLEAAASGRPRKNDDMLERSSDWRYCLIRAAMALHINPEGKGHRILEAASRIDPDPDVRSIAREAYETLRRTEGLPDGVSPRRTVMSAFWWFRQAHLLSLGFEIDADGAQRTRVKELTRTRDQEAYDKPQS